MFTSPHLDPFATKHLLSIPLLDITDNQTWHGFTFDSDLKSELLSLAETKSVKLEHLRTDILQLSLDQVPLPNAELSAHSSAGTSEDEERQTESKHDTDYDEEDVWTFTDVQKPRQECNLISWDQFINQEHEEAHTAYISEAGAAVFDLLIQKFAPAKDLKYTRHDLLLHALFELGTGHNSAFFSWNDDKQSFEKVVDDYTLHGVSEELLGRIVDGFLKSGTQFRRLEHFTKISAKGDSTTIALASATNSVLNNVREYLNDLRRHIQTVIQLDEVFERTRALITALGRLVQSCSTHQNHISLGNILTCMEELSREEPQLEYLLHQISARIAQPFLCYLSEEIGTSSARSTINQDIRDSFAAAMPPLINNRIGTIRNTLVALADTNKDVLPPSSPSESSELTIGFNWQDIVELQNRADCYEQDFKDTTVTGSKIGTKESTLGLTSSLVLSDGAPFDIRFDVFQNTGRADSIQEAQSEDKIREAVQMTLFVASNGFSQVDLTCRQALEMSVTPMLTAQHRLLSFSVIRLLFQEHDLLMYLKILYRFQLFADGTFTSRLSTALFDSEQTSGEVRRRTKASTGLRLQYRETWPPASSELRLVLQGILTESMSDIRNIDMIESTSFAIRDLSDGELERCRDINSIYALDFLQLHHKPSNKLLEMIITHEILQEYDRVSIHLLRLMRMKSLAQDLLLQVCQRHNRTVLGPREHRFRHKIQHFITVLVNYSHNVAIATPRLKFAKTVNDINKTVLENDYDGTLSLVQSLDHLRQMHEGVLEDITRGLLLEKKQFKARRLMEDIFGIILKYAGTATTTATTTTKEQSVRTKNDETTISRLYDEFHEKVKNFIGTVVQLISDQNEDGTSEVLDYLVLSLDFNRYYNR